MMLKQAAKKPPKIDIIPMVDIVFQLIIFFLVATQVKQEETAVDLRLPSAQMSESIEGDESPPILINVLRPEIKNNDINKGRPYVMSGKGMNLDELKKALEERKKLREEYKEKVLSVRIRADADADFQDVRDALAAATEIGAQEVRVATVKKA